MNLDPQPARQVRLLTTHEGKFLNLPDMIERLKDVRVLDEALALLKVGHDRKDDPHEIIRRVIGEFVASCGGDMPRTESDFRGSGKI